MTSIILRLPEVIKMTGLSRSSIYFMIGKDDFPKQILLGARAVGWLEKEVKQWIDSRTSNR